jgi:hypothetical protein
MLMTDKSTIICKIFGLKKVQYNIPLPITLTTREVPRLQVSENMTVRRMVEFKIMCKEELKI